MSDYAEMIRREGNWRERLAAAEAENETLRAALERIANGPYPLTAKEARLCASDVLARGGDAT